MSLFLSLAILSLPAIAAPISGWAYSSIASSSNVEAAAFGPDAHPGSWTPRGITTVPKTSLVSSTSLADSLSTDLDTGLSLALQGLAPTHPVLDSYLGSWVSSDELGSHLGLASQGQVISTTCLIIQAGENPETWVSIPDGEISSQTVTDLEFSSWVLLDDLACGLTENAFVPIHSILLYQPDESSNVAVYVCLENPESTLSALPLDHPLDSFLYADITGISSDFGLGDVPDATAPPAENLTSDLHLDVPAHVWSETDPLASNDNLAIDANLAIDNASNSPTSTSSSLTLDTDLASGALNSSFDSDVGVASNPSDPNGLGGFLCS